MAISTGGKGAKGLFTEINITPLTDIFLVLLIIMMVIAPMFQQANQEIKVPKLQSGQSMEESQVTVEITKDGKMFVNGKGVQEASLIGQLTELKQSSGQKQVVVRADKLTQSKDVMKVFEAAGQAGFEKLTIAGEPLSGERQSELQQSSSNVAPSQVETPQ